jgi:two-component system, cell cycle sensor histidine kinase and response regulator CckA
MTEDGIDPDEQRERRLHAERLQAIGQLAVEIAHDVSNVLTAILNSAEMLARVADPAVREEATHIDASVARGAALLKRLLAFARPQAVRPSVVKVNEALAAVSGMLRRVLGRGIRLEVAPGEAGSILIDPTQLDQALLNLAVNARDAMPEGGTLTLCSARVVEQPPETGVPSGHYIAVEVTDTGSGIPPDVLPRIFDPFFSTKTGGTGLGLSTVHDIVRRVGGQVRIETAAGRGTTFRLMFPEHEGTAGEPAPSPTGSPAPRSRLSSQRRVMLVEDEEPVRRVAQRALEAQGWTVLACDSGETALQLAATCERPDAVVSDVALPGMDGAALVRALREGWPGLVGILVSGYPEEAHTLEGVRFLPKPYTLKQMSAALDAALASAPAD